MGSSQRWIEGLSEEDLAFLKRFVLSSGSLKELAKAYGISYPTVRLRLDRLIEKIKLLAEAEVVSDFEQLLRLELVEGRIEPESMKRLLAAHKKELKEPSADP